MIAALMAAAVFVSCDGGMVIAGPAVWTRGDAGWEQRHGDAAAAPATDGAERASCTPAPVSNTPPVLGGMARIGGSSRDRSLLWSAEKHIDGSRQFRAKLWTGHVYRTVVDTRE